MTKTKTNGFEISTLVLPLVNVAHKDHLPTGSRALGLKFSLRACVYTKETLEQHLAQGATQVFLWYKKHSRRDDYD